MNISKFTQKSLQAVDSANNKCYICPRTREKAHPDSFPGLE